MKIKILLKNFKPILGNIKTNLTIFKIYPQEQDTFWSFLKFRLFMENFKKFYENHRNSRRSSDIPDDKNKILQYE